MAAITPKRSSRVPHTHTPKMSDRKKGLFQSELETTRNSLTAHRQLPVLDSESDSEACGLGIISTLDSSSSDENDLNPPKTPERRLWHETRSQKVLREDYALKNFIKSPFTLKKFQTRYSYPEKCTGSVSTPATPHWQNHPGTPSSTHSCASAHTVSSTSSRARKSLASLIADTESCSSSLKDLNFDTDSGTDSKENTPTKVLRRSTRKQKLTPKFRTFKGILMEQKKNVSPIKTAMVCLTKMDMSSFISPTRMLRTPNTTSEIVGSPPKIQNRRPAVEIAESPESANESEKSHKRLREDSLNDAPSCKYPRLDVPKARLSLFNSDRLKEILSAKCFYGKSNPDLNTNVTRRISHAIEASATHHRRPFSHSHSRRKRKPGQINLGVKHKIRKPKYDKAKKYNMKINHSASTENTLNNTVISMKNTSSLSHNSSQELANDKVDPFDKEKQTIEALLSQWTEEDVPESELVYIKPRELPCFNSTIIEETNPIFQPVTAVPVTADLPQDEAVIIELGAKQNDLANSVSKEMLPQVQIIVQNQGVSTEVIVTRDDAAATEDIVMVEPEGHAASHGEFPKSGHFLPVEGGYILVDDNQTEAAQEELPDLDKIERELRMLDEQILKIAQSNNINPETILGSTETVLYPTISDGIPALSTAVQDSPKSDKTSKLFPIFSKPDPGTGASSSTKGSVERASKKPLLKSTIDQYVIDAGQRKFGATQCTECGTIYQIGDPQDEHDHLVHHNATDVLKFNGWKEECVVGKFEAGRCIRIRGGEPGWKKVESLLNRVVHPQLGYEGNLPRENVHAYTAYLYIEKKQIIGCLIMEPKIKAYKLIPGDPDCCSVQDYPVKCGISRLWTHINHRRRGIATRLVECGRASFLYGDALRITDISFSAPTAAGKTFASNYCGSANFYVYLD